MRFGALLPDLAASPLASAPPPPDPALLATLRAEAEAAGHAQGFAEGLAEGLRRQAAAQEAAIAASLGLIAASLTTAAEEGERAAVLSAEALAGLLLSAMDAALPEEAARAGPVLLARVAETLRPALTDRPEARLLVAPALVDAVAARLPNGPQVVADSSVAPGDGRIEWRDGAQLVSLAARSAAVREALAAAGFIIGSDEA